MKRVIGFEAFQALGFAPSRIPPWAGTLVGAAEVDDDLAVIVEVTTWVMTLAMMGSDAMVSCWRIVIEKSFRALDYPRICDLARAAAALKRRRCGSVRPRGTRTAFLIADKSVLPPYVYLSTCMSAFSAGFKGDE